MHSRAKRFAVLLVLAFVGPGAGLIHGRRVVPRSRVVYPLQRLPISFSHVQHLKMTGVSCASCHAGVATSTSVLDNNLPGEAACVACHAIERDKPNKQVKKGQPDAKCSSCHVGSGRNGATLAIVLPPANLKFNHNVHATRNIGCEVCHGDLVAEKVGLATRQHLPTMQTCLACHKGTAKKTASARCSTCHITEPGGRLRTLFVEGRLVPTGSLRGDRHGLNFRKSHDMAKTEQTYCETCHKKKFCVDCHNGIKKPMDFHGNDYMHAHAVDARRNSPDCSGCHRTQTFCVGCHSRSGVTTDRRVSAFDRASTARNNRFHKTGWFSTFDTGMRRASHHSFQAQRNIRSCASCHRETFCMSCHSSTLSGERISPHPAGFGRSKRCRSLAAKNRRVCSKCHVDSARTRCQ